MARYTFGGGVSDWTLLTGDDVTVGAITGKVAVVAGGITVTFWSQAVGGSQYIDLIDGDGTPVTEVVSSSGTETAAVGQILTLWGPDGVAEMWASANGGPRSRMVTRGAIDFTELSGIADVGTPTNGVAVRYNDFVGWTADRPHLGDLQQDDALNRQVAMWVEDAFGGWESTFVQMNDLGDVNDNAAASGDMLRYNSTTGEWAKINLSGLAMMSGLTQRPSGTNVTLTGVEQMVDSVTFTARTATSYKVLYDAPAINGATVGDVVTIRIRWAAGASVTTAGTQVHSRTFTIDRANTDLPCHFFKVFTPNVNGQVTVGISMVRSTGAGAITAKGDCSLLVEGYH